jgi:hypothetical protein
MSEGFYPGSSPFDLTSEKFSHTQNFFSDLGREVTYSGINNAASSFVFACAMCAIGFGLLCLSAASSHITFELNRGKVICVAGIICGVISSAFMVSAGMNPWDTMFYFHVWSVNFGFGFLLLFLVLIGIAQIMNKISALFWTANIFTALCIIVQALILIYGPHYSTREGLPLQVVMQKIIVIVFLLNLLFQSYGLRKIIKGKS